jgi:hypothetical protein
MLLIPGVNIDRLVEDGVCEYDIVLAILQLRKREMMRASQIMK